MLAAMREREAAQARAKGFATPSGLTGGLPGQPAVGSPGAAAGVSAQTGSLASIEDPAAARQVLGLLGKLEAAADVPAGTPPEKVVTIFFDPRCPFCHAAFTAMHGKIAARWVPVVVLGEPEVGNRMAAAILASPDRVDTLASTFAAKQDPGGMPAQEATAKVTENREAFASVFAAAPSLRPGVPTMFVPRPDGRVTIMIGFEAGDEAKVQALVSGS